VQGHHKAQTFFEDTKSSHGVAEPAPIGVQMITRHKGDQAPYMMERRSRPKDSKLSGQNPGWFTGIHRTEEPKPLSCGHIREEARRPLHTRRFIGSAKRSRRSRMYFPQ